MRLRSTSPLVAGVVLLAACAQHHGDFPILASESVYRDLMDTSHAVSYPRSTGRACFSLWRVLLRRSDPALSNAVREALRARPGANALALVELMDYGECIEVSGVPVRIE